MVMASKVKADKSSEKLSTVSATSKKVSQATAEVIEILGEYNFT